MAPPSNSERVDENGKIGLSTYWDKWNANIRGLLRSGIKGGIHAKLAKPGVTGALSYSV